MKNVEVNLECTLEEMYNGCVKKLVYERRVLNSDGRTTSIKEEEIDVEVFKGYDKSIKVTFPGYGNEAPGQKNCKNKLFLIFFQLILSSVSKKKNILNLNESTRTTWSSFRR